MSSLKHHICMYINITESRFYNSITMNSISQSFKGTPINLSKIIPLDFKNAAGIPDSHEWTLSMDPPVVNPTASGSIPVVNLSDPNAMSLIGHACEKWGAFQVINHGVPTNLLEIVELQARRLFSLPTCQKQCALRSPDGITGYGLPPISKFFPKLFWSEGFAMMGSPAEHATKLWPHEPEQQLSFCNVMEDYQKELKTLTERILELILRSLGLSPEDLKWFKPETGCTEAQYLLQLNSYPACPDPGRVMGMAAHTDSSLLTVLYQSNSRPIGLQVLRDGVGWVPVHPIPGALVVNLGDLMHILSNSKFKSITHRAVVDKTHHRISTAWFYGPPSDVKISPLIRLTDHDHPPHYRPVTWKEYLSTRATHFNKALELIKVGLQQQSNPI